MAYDFPNSPTVGQAYSGYTWDGEKWVSTPNVPNTAGVIGIQVFTAGGTYTPSANMTTCVIECVGGGGGGGGATGVSGSIVCAGGGGSGSYSRKMATAATIGVSQAVTVGAGGTASTGAGGAGGDSSVGALCIGKGGSGAAASTTSAPMTGGAGGVPGTGDFTSRGNSGGVGMGSAQVGFHLVAGYGGASIFGGGIQAPGGTLAGAAGSTYGAGGGGGYVYNVAGNPQAGGAGAAGVVIVTEYGMTALTGASATGAVRYDLPQGLSANQTAQARANIAVTKRNYIINGGMQISQENGATAGTATGYYPVDQFGMFLGGTSGAWSTAQIVSMTPGGSAYRFRVTATTADAAVAAGDIVYIETRIEGYRVSDLQFGTALAKTVTVQFGVKAPAGTYSVVIFNSGTTRSYVAEYVIAAGEANTDVVKTVTVPGDITGVWLKDNFQGLNIRFGLMAGTTFQQAAGSWGTGNVVGSPNQFNFMGTINNVFELFDVSLTEGTVAPPFQLPDYASELMLCKRYFAIVYAGGNGFVSAGSQNWGFYSFFQTDMRAIPTVTWLSNGTLSNCGNPAVGPISGLGFLSYALSTAGGSFQYVSNFKANARL